MFSGRFPGFEADAAWPPLIPAEITGLAEDHASLYTAIDCIPRVQARSVRLCPFHPGVERDSDCQGRGSG